MPKKPTPKPITKDLCIDVAAQGAATRKAPQESSNAARGVSVAGGPLRLVMFTSKLWRPSQYLRVRFLEGTASQKANVTSWAGKWSEYANLIFQFDSGDANAEILVKFQPLGNWSFIGTDSLQSRSNGCTLNIQNLDQGTTQHEFGHAIGCVHEHQSPVNGIPWNKEVVYRDLGGPPNNWSRAKVDSNLFQAYSRNQTQFTAVDRKSIMMYAIPSRWTTNGFSTDWNGELSGNDKAFVAAIYPGATALFSQPKIRTGHCSVRTGAGTTYNQAYGNSWIMHAPGKSYLEVTFNQPKTFGGKRVYSNAVLRLTHLTSSIGGPPVTSPINIVVNGTKVKDNYSPPSHGWLQEDFDISKEMKDGANKVRLEFQSQARSNYWINTLKVICSGGESLQWP